jgi:TfoX/Sxy family transcriptional regulator of competence genes
MIDPYASVKAHFEKIDGVTVNAGRGAQGLKVGKKMFAMFSKGDLLLKLPPDRVEALVASGRGVPYDPGTGKILKNYVLIPAAKKRSWIKLCEEAAESAS